VIGQIQVTWGEFLTRVLKLGLVWTFATNAAYGIGITYNFFLNGVELGVGWALKAILPMLGQIPNTGGETIAFAYLDQILYLIVATQFTTAGGALIGFMAAMSYIYPPIFAMFVTFFLFAMEMMMRTVMIYLVGIGAIGFLIALAPIFLGFALFRVTYSFFDDWLRYLISFTLQIVLGFICLAMWLSVIGYFTYFFGALMDIIKPVPPQVLAAAGAKLNVNPWGVCPFLPGPWTLTGPIPVCDPLGGDPILPSALGSNDDFISFMTLNLTSLCAIMYAFCHLMRGVPDIARNLAGPSYFASLGGAQMPSLFRDAVGEVTGAAQDATASTDLRTRFERDRARNQPLPPRERPPHAGG